MTFATTLLEWFRENGRALPWRETRDPYAIWLSEIILQQTRIDQGLPYWERFMRRWPTVDALAAASEDEVLREWQGLGYYSRARNLHAAAKQVSALGGFPTTIKGLLSLKGIGALAQELLLPALNREGTGAGLFNQALMDFGAIQCTPAKPLCLQCPLQDSCVAFREGRTAELPVKQKTLKIKERHLVYIYIRYNGETALRRRPAGDIWQGLYEPLLTDALPSDTATGTPVGCGAILLRQGVKHVLTHRVLYADFWLWQPAERPQLPEGYFWLPESDRDRYAVPRLIEKMFEEV